MTVINYSKIADKEKDREAYNYVEDFEEIMSKEKIEKAVASQVIDTVGDKKWREYIKRNEPLEEMIVDVFTEFFQKQVDDIVRQVEKVAIERVEKYMVEKGGPGSGNWEGPGNPRFAHQGKPKEGREGGAGSGIELFDVEISGDKPTQPSRVFPEYKNRAEVEVAFGKSEVAYAKKLTTEEKAALIRYTSDGNYINEELRNGDSKTNEKDIKLLDSALSKSSFPKTAKVSRYMIIENNKDLDSKLKSIIGKTIRDKGYLSTSLEYRSYEPLIEEYAKFVDKKDVVVVQMRIEIERGSKAALLQKVGNPYSSSEVLLPRGAKLGIRNIYQVENERMIVGGMKTMVMEAVYGK